MAGRLDVAFDADVALARVVGFDLAWVSAAAIRLTSTFGGCSMPWRARLNQCQLLSRALATKSARWAKRFGIALFWATD